jgi:GH25 family lysozyme M1 (1,4-beta-N-acetylmuramidase)
MSIKFTLPINLSHLKLGEVIAFQGISDNGVTKVELLADDKFKLGETGVYDGTWTISYPFNRAGKRRIIANGLDANQQQISSDAVDVFLVGARQNELGIDIYSNNGDSIDWQTVKNSDISFAFAKATEGETFVDSQFAKHWKSMKATGLIRGAYHFFRPLKDPKLQADNFLKQIQDWEIGDLPPVLDIEHYPEKIASEWQQVSLNQRIDIVQQWLDKVESVTGRKPIIYSSPSFWDEYMKESQAFINYPLWLAHYTDKPEPTVPANNWGGKGWTIWQYTESGTVAGVNGFVDRNRFNSSFDDLVAFIKGSLIA